MKKLFIIFSFIFAVSALADTNSFFPTNSIIYIDDFADYDTESTFIDTKPIPQSFLETTADKIERIAVINSNPGKYSKKEEGDQFTVAAKSFFSVNKDVTDKVATKLFVFGGFGDSVKDDLIYADKDFSIGKNCDVQSTKIVDCSGYSYYELVTSNYIWSVENTNWIAYGSSKSVATTKAPHNASGYQTGEVLTDRAVLHTRLTRENKVSGVDGRVVFIVSENPNPNDDNDIYSSAALDDPETWPIIKNKYVEKIKGSRNPKNKISHNYRWTVTGLDPNTRYYYRIWTRSYEKNKNGVYEFNKKTQVATFKTLPLPNTTTDVEFTVITGMMIDYRDADDKKDGHKIFKYMLEKGAPDFIVLTGDTVYYDSGDMKGKSKWLNWAHTYKWTFQSNFFNQVPGYWQVDDHDYWRDNINKTQTKGWNIFRKSHPTPGGFLFPGSRIKKDKDGDGISDDNYYDKAADYYKDDYGACDGDGTNYWRTFRYGRNLQIWLEEGHHHRYKKKRKINGVKTPDDDRLKAWGGDQLKWLTNSIKNSVATFKLLITTTPVAGPSALVAGNNQDKHSGSKFRVETRAFLNAVYNVDNFHIICGDRHWKYHGNFFETNYKKIQEFCCGPTSNPHSKKSFSKKELKGDGWSKPLWAGKKRWGGYLQVKVAPWGDGTRLSVYWKDIEGNAGTKADEWLSNKSYDTAGHIANFKNPWHSPEISLNSPPNVATLILSADINEEKVTLKWQKINGAYGYEIQGPNSEGGTETFHSIVSDDDDIIYDWPHDLPNGDYTFKIWAVNKNGAYSVNSKDIQVEINVSPLVASSTYPNINKEYDSIEFKATWEITKINEKFVTGYRYDFDQNPLTELDENNKLFTENNNITKNIEDFEDGTYYFHIQSKSEMNDKIYWSQTAHYKFNIKKGAPIKGKPNSGIWFK